MMHTLRHRTANNLVWMQLSTTTCSETGICNYVTTWLKEIYALKRLALLHVQSAATSLLFPIRRWEVTTEQFTVPNV